MKKYFLIIILAFATSVSFSQDLSDAVRYAQDNITGTARYRAMGGAFGALGGDFSSLTVNPAGSAIFNNNQAAFSISSINTSAKSNYFGSKTRESDNSFDVNQAGAVWIFENQSETKNWKKLALAITYENTNNFDVSEFSQGINPNNSIANYFTSYANGIPVASITDNNFESLSYRSQQAYLGYEGYVIGANPNSTTNQYESNLSSTGNYFQQNSVSSTGYNGKLSFNAAAAYKDRLYLGLNLNSHFSDYTRNSSFFENYSNATNNDPSTGVQKLRFSNDLYTYGTGFSFQFGAIAKVTNDFRVGLSYESPTWYSLNDELLQTLNVDCADCPNNSNPFFADPNTVIIYPTYRLQTPSKATGSLAYVFGKKGLLSFDYTARDYSNTKFRPQSDYQNENSQIENLLTTTSEFRFGGEYKIKQWSLRGGYRFEQSPFKNRETIGNLKNYTTGFGYSFGQTKVDLAYSLVQRENQKGFFSQGLVDAATINSRNDNVTLTILFEL